MERVSLSLPGFASSSPVTPKPVAQPPVPDPRSIMGLLRAQSARGARPAGVLLSIGGHVLALGLVAAGLEAKSPAPRRESEPVRVRLSLAMSRPAGAKEAPARPRRPPPPRRLAPVPAPAIVAPATAIDPAPVESLEDPITESSPEDTVEAGGAAGEGSPTDAPPGAPGGLGESPLSLGQVARPPGVLTQVTPDYPPAARREHIVGLVLLRAVIDREGRVERHEIRVLRSLPQLDAAAIAALLQWRFTPAIGHDGRPVRVVVEIPFEFSLS